MIKNKNMKKIYLLIIFANLLLGKKAVIVSEVADLLAEPGKEFFLPVAPVNFRDGISCPRMHQALANEVIEILETSGSNSKVKISNCFFQTASSNTKHSSYWIKNKHFIIHYRISG